MELEGLYQLFVMDTIMAVTRYIKKPTKLLTKKSPNYAHETGDQVVMPTQQAYIFFIYQPLPSGRGINIYIYIDT